jgi:hypothetical protein
MNWFKKIASVTFWVADTDKISQPMNILDICFDIVKFIYYEANIGEGSGVKSGHVEPDTSRTEFNKPLGYINFYTEGTNIDKEFVTKAIEMYNQARFDKIKIVVRGEEVSGLGRGNVVRLEVVGNNTVNLEEIPEVNITNSNAHALLSLLSQEGVSSISGGLSGKININELKNAILDIENNDYILETHTQEPYQNVEEGSPTVYNGGRSVDQFKSYFEKLKQMINYVEQNNIPNRFINYG